MPNTKINKKLLYIDPSKPPLPQGLDHKSNQYLIFKFPNPIPITHAKFN